eukprot:RCo038858
MDKVVSQVLSCKKTDLESLKKFFDQNAALIKANSAHLLSAVGALDPARHDFAICYLLWVRSQNAVDIHFAAACETLFDGFVPGHIREHCLDKFATLVQKYAEALRRERQPQRGIPVLLRLIPKLCPTVDDICPAHAEFALLCLLAKNYKVARKVLDNTVFEVNPKLTGLTPRSFLLYYYYGGMIWVGLKKWQQAFTFFQSVLTMPCSCLSAIMVEAFKKFVIVSLITKGKLDALPKQCSGIVHRTIRRFAMEYVEVATAYGKRETAKVKELVSKHRAIFEEDHNMGLMGQALARYQWQAIQRLTSTYLTLSLSDIASNVGLTDAKEAEAVLVKMIQAGQLSAVISQKDGMVSFTDDISASALVENLDTDVEAAQKAICRLEALNEEIECSREYLVKQTLREPHQRDDSELPSRAARPARQHKFTETFMKP